MTLEVAAWLRALGRAGLTVRRQKDLTENVAPTLLHRQRRAVEALGEWRRRNPAPSLPADLSRSFAQAIAAPLVFCGPGPMPLPPLGTLRYSKLVAALS